MSTEATIECLVGKTFDKVENRGGVELVFTNSDGPSFKFYHEQGCCEDVRIEDICGNLSDLEGVPILSAEEVSGNLPPTEDCYDSYTWTFYKFATSKGYVDVRWLGRSNGYYSERVDFAEVEAL